MGKIGKKSKSDRINALRKQYDAFLDEDKKRKDRNEFILGSLEKMRLYTPAVGSVHQNMVNPQINKYHFVPQERPEHQRKIRFDDNPILRSRVLDVSPVCVKKDEEILLQEISKKYILIPKLRPTNENILTYYNPPSVNNDADWRNKYNILDELKKIEKEGEVSQDKPHLTYDNFNNDHDDTKEHKHNIDSHPIDNTQQISQKLHVPKLEANETKTVKTKNLGDIDCTALLERGQDIIPNSVKNTDFKNEMICKPDLGSNNQDNNISVLNNFDKGFKPHENEINVEEINEIKNNEKLIYNQEQDIQQSEINLIENSVPINIDTENSQNNSIEISNTDIVESNFTPIINKKENIVHQLKNDEITASPLENIENQQPPTNIGESKPGLENVQRQKYEPNNESTTISDNVIPSQIDEFEAEQKEMFYSEAAEHNQNVDTMENNIPTEEYTNEQYSYYNESQQDQPYYAEINEHEESTERYDPNYEQQYVENYDENVNVAQYENQQYGENNYENQPVTNVTYEPQPDEPEVPSVNYEEQLAQQEATTENYEQQPVNYEYEHTGHPDNPDQSHVENMNMYDSQASEHVTYENQQYNEMGEVEHPTNPDYNVYDNQEDYVQNTENETIQNLEQQLDGEEGYTETKSTLPNEPSTEIENDNKLESNIKVT